MIHWMQKFRGEYMRNAFPLNCCCTQHILTISSSLINQCTEDFYGDSYLTLFSILFRISQASGLWLPGQGRVLAVVPCRSHGNGEHIDGTSDLSSSFTLPDALCGCHCHDDPNRVGSPDIACSILAPFSWGILQKKALFSLYKLTPLPCAFLRSISGSWWDTSIPNRGKPSWLSRCREVYSVSPHWRVFRKTWLRSSTWSGSAPRSRRSAWCTTTGSAPCAPTWSGEWAWLTSHPRQWIQRQVIKEQVGARQYRDGSLRSSKGLTVHRQVVKEQGGGRQYRDGSLRSS